MVYLFVDVKCGLVTLCLSQISSSSSNSSSSSSSNSSSSSSSSSNSSSSSSCSSSSSSCSSTSIGSIGSSTSSGGGRSLSLISIYLSLFLPPPLSFSLSSSPLYLSLLFSFFKMT